jgi:small-conductance mechanosensitive channel
MELSPLWNRLENLGVSALKLVPGLAVALVVELADFAVKLRVRWWIAPPRRDDVVGTRDEVLAQLKARLLAEGIDLPYPTTRVLLHDRTEEDEVAARDRDRDHRRPPSSIATTSR